MEKLPKSKKEDLIADSKHIPDVAFDENDEYIVIKVKGKERYVPKEESIGINGKTIKTQKLIKALALFPDEDPAEALEKLDAEEKNSMEA